MVALIVYDGQQLRCFHLEALPDAHRQALRVIAAQAVARVNALSVTVGASAVRAVEPVIISPTERLELEAKQRTLARAQGFTGNQCDRCQQMTMVQTGTCETCQSCGNTSGSCS
jgi:hypothetical protein